MDVARCQHDSQKGSKGAELLAANNKILLVTHANLRVVSKNKKETGNWQPEVGSTSCSNLSSSKL